MAYSQEITDKLRAFFSASGIHTTFEERENVALFTLRMKLSCRLQSAQMLLIVREDNFSALAQIPLPAGEDTRLAVAEYITRANFNMRNGNFELNMDDGEIRFKTYVHAGKEPLDMNAARLAITLPFVMFNRFGDGLLDVLFGFKSPREAFEAVRG